MPRKELGVEPEVDNSFLERASRANPNTKELRLARERYADVFPDDVLEELARQQTIARPLLEQYHIMAEATPTVAMARALRMKEIDEISDSITGMNLTYLDDASDIPPEYVCPKCRHGWSGQPGSGSGDRVYVPTGTVNNKGRVTTKRWGAPGEWRNWSEINAQKANGGVPTPEPVVFNTWRRKYRGT